MNAKDFEYEQRMILEGDHCSCNRLNACFYHSKYGMHQDMLDLKKLTHYKLNYGYLRYARG